MSNGNDANPNQSGEQSEQIDEELLAHYWGDGYESVGYPSMERLKVAQPDDYAKLMTLNALIRRERAEAVKLFSERLPAKNVCLVRLQSDMNEVVETDVIHRAVLVADIDAELRATGGGEGDRAM